MPINLLPKTAPEESSFWEEVYRWSRTIGRVVIITTEAIVLGVFFSRFFLDPKITDLSEETRIKQVIIKTTGDLEDRFRTLQDRLVAIKKIKQSQRQYSRSLGQFVSLVPPGIAFSTLDVAQNQLRLTASTPQTGEFVRFITQLLGWEDVLQVSLSRASVIPESGGIEFSLEVEVYPSAYAYQPEAK